MSVLDLIRERIDTLECPICGETIINAIDFKCVEDLSISKHKIWICKKHPFPEDPNWGKIITAIASGAV